MVRQPYHFAADADSKTMRVPATDVCSEALNSISMSDVVFGGDGWRAAVDGEDAT
ncbi:hypothetical protein [Halococcus sp. IIIV-5B]|uniref:hypothetical protein n=1 Tax=Halococcus sp. IIIV-5B TaxID=2321230 RepID=UPI001314AFC8|nr:hypothetical protein [Halococcus sp. IIIV-5B]